MICVLSQPSLETSTDLVIDWLDSWFLPYVRVSGTDIDRIGGITLRLGSDRCSGTLRVGDRTLSLDQITVAWYRRWYHNCAFKRNRLLPEATHRQHLTLIGSLDDELNRLSQYLFESLAEPSWLGAPFIPRLNKLQVLKHALDCGLSIPRTLVTTTKEDLVDFVGQFGSVISKPIAEAYAATLGGVPCTTFSTVIAESDIATLPWDGSFPSLFQEVISKAYEIRAFYIDGVFYSMAMFTQARVQTSVDFRRYDHMNPARTVPYRLPDEIESQLSQLMRKLKLDTGSFDLIRTQDGQFVFLEVNPVGQFGMVSTPCNYFLERRVAEALRSRWLKALSKTQEMP